MREVWRPVKEIDRVRDGETGGSWAGFRESTSWELTPVLHQTRRGHEYAPTWYKDGPDLSRRPPDGAWYDWESETILPFRPS